MLAPSFLSWRRGAASALRQIAWQFGWSTLLYFMGLGGGYVVGCYCLVSRSGTEEELCVHGFVKRKSPWRSEVTHTGVETPLEGIGTRRVSIIPTLPYSAPIDFGLLQE